MCLCISSCGRHWAFCLVHLCILGNHCSASSVALPECQMAWPQTAWKLKSLGVFSLCQLLAEWLFASYFPWVCFLICKSGKLMQSCYETCVRWFMGARNPVSAVHRHPIYVSSLLWLLCKADILFPHFIGEVTEIYKGYVTYQSSCLHLEKAPELVFASWPPTHVLGIRWCHVLWV